MIGLKRSSEASTQQFKESSRPLFVQPTLQYRFYTLKKSIENYNFKFFQKMPSRQQDPLHGQHQSTCPQNSFAPFKMIQQYKRKQINYSTQQYIKNHRKSHPSDAKMLTRATTCPGLGFLVRAFPITEQENTTIINLFHCPYNSLKMIHQHQYIFEQILHGIKLQSTTAYHV